jgi:hypothetical protein
MEPVRLNRTDSQVQVDLRRRAYAHGQTIAPQTAMSILHKSEVPNGRFGSDDVYKNLQIALQEMKLQM